MSEEIVSFGAHRIRYELKRSARQTLEVLVLPNGGIEVRAPFDASPERIAGVIERRATWILKQQRYFEQFRPRTPERRWVPGETHRYLGKQLRLRLGDVEAPLPVVRLTRAFIMVDGLRREDAAGIERLIRGWQGERMRELCAARIPICAKRFENGIEPAAVVVRDMRSRWASMSHRGRLTVNPALIQAPVDAIDYVLAHELAHMFVLDHGPGFVALMDRVMPDHKKRKSLLERSVV